MWGRLLGEYWSYCGPLIISSWISFAKVLSDRWILQNFGGAEQQAYFAVGVQVAAITLLASSSILRIFWKEIAEAAEKGLQGRIQSLYQRLSLYLMVAGAATAGALIPWAREIAVLGFGRDYEQAWLILAIILFFSIHQPFGQLATTMLFATGKTRHDTLIGIIPLVLGLPLVYYAVAPSSAVVGGLGLGAAGLGLKLVAMQLVTVYVANWVIARLNGWRPIWKPHIVAIVALCVLGFASKYLMVGLLQPFLPLWLTAVSSLMVYSLAAAGFVYAFPWLIGSTRYELTNQVTRVWRSCECMLSGLAR